MLFLSLPIVTNSLFGQTVKGRIVNDDDAAPLSGVIIQNLNRSRFHTLSDKDGHYEINVGIGDSVQFVLLGFTSKIVIYSGENQGWFSWIGMKPQNFVIDTVVVHKGLTKYQKDSSERREIYGRKVDERPAKFRLSRTDPNYKGGGRGMVNFDAPLSAPFQRISRKNKQLKQFQEQYKLNEEQLFIYSRYNPDSVTALTGLQNDSLYQFMQACPMSYSFARAASTLEIKMWIRHNYKEWIKHPVINILAFPELNPEADSLRKP